jgi:hypothetical protein
MTTEEILKQSAAVLGWLTAIVGWIIGAVQWRKKRKVEAELKLIRRRAEAPYLAASDAVFNCLYTSLIGSELRCFQPGMENLLCFQRDEVGKNLIADNPVLFVIENSGQAARSVAVSLDGVPIQLKREPDIQDAQGLQFLEYPYQPAKHGQTQQLVIDFESSGGVQDRHTYQIIHGARSLKRTDPP